MPFAAWFVVENENGSVDIEAGSICENRVVLKLERALQGAATVSYATGNAPLQPMLCDSTTYLPLLSFYQFEIKQEECI